MSNEPSGTEERTDLEVTVCANGGVSVHRPESDRARSVFVDGDGGVVRCSCKGHRFHGHCAHRDAIEACPLVRSSASAAAASPTPTVATDGGKPVAETDDTEADTDPCDEDKADTELAAGPAINTATGWGTSEYPRPEDEEVNDEPL